MDKTIVFHHRISAMKWGSNLGIGCREFSL
jgi:hypothetical protein